MIDANKKRPTTSHRDYVLDRASRLKSMFGDLEDSEGLREKFHEDPEVVGARYGITLSDEEVFAIKSVRPSSLANLRERLSINPVGLFDANCSCALFEKGFIERVK